MPPSRRSGDRLQVLSQPYIRRKIKTNLRTIAYITGAIKRGMMSPPHAGRIADLLNET